MQLVELVIIKSIYFVMFKLRGHFNVNSWITNTSNIHFANNTKKLSALDPDSWPFIAFGGHFGSYFGSHLGFDH